MFAAELAQGLGDRSVSVLWLMGLWDDGRRHFLGSCGRSAPPLLGLMCPVAGTLAVVCDDVSNILDLVMHGALHEANLQDQGNHLPNSLGLEGGTWSGIWLLAHLHNPWAAGALATDFSAQDLAQGSTIGRHGLG